MKTMVMIMILLVTMAKPTTINPMITTPLSSAIMIRNTISINQKWKQILKTKEKIKIQWKGKKLNIIHFFMKQTRNKTKNIKTNEMK